MVKAHRLRVSLLVFGSLVILAFQPAHAERFRPIGIGGNISTQTSPDWSFLSFDPAVSPGAQITIRPNGRWWLEGSFRTSSSNLSSRVVRTTIDALDTSLTRATFEASRYSFTVSYSVFGRATSLQVPFGIGVGLLDWKVKHPSGDTVLRTLNPDNLSRPLSASELFLTARTGLVGFVGTNLSFSLLGEVDLLTGAGTEFRTVENDAREKIRFGGQAALTLWFGRSGPAATVWESDKLQQQTTPPSADQKSGVPRKPDGFDSDGDGVPDSRDRCQDSPIGAFVNDDGCPLDADKDGVPDGLDDCPGTVAAARQAVDQHGCPRDIDFDGYPDFVDVCPTNQIGAVVDSLGCPIDSDKDGVPDGLDDCPETMFGMEVDSRGCLDVSGLNQPLVLNINYQSGSFEIDPKAKERLRKLANLLALVPQFTLEISGYTDDIGTDDANRLLSEKRARRVLDFLFANGVAKERMTATGRGEADPIASNQTAEGRTKNRRIVIQFFRP